MKDRVLSSMKPQASFGLYLQSHECIFHCPTSNNKVSSPQVSLTKAKLSCDTPSLIGRDAYIIIIIRTKNPAICPIHIPKYEF